MGRYGIRDILDVTILDYTTKKPVMYLTSLKSSNLESKSETVYARGGRGNPKLIGWDSSRDETFKFQDALISPEGLALLFGSTLSEGALTVTKTETLVVNEDNEITLSHTPLGTNGADKFFFISEDGTSLGEEQVYAATAATGKYQITGSTVTFFTDVPEGTFIVAKYKYTSAATTKTISIDAQLFPKTYTIIGEAFFRLETGVDVPCEFVIHKGKIMPDNTITLANTGDPSVFDFTVDALKAIGSSKMVDIHIFEA